MTVCCPTCRRPLSEHSPVESLADAKMEPQSRTIIRALAEAYPRAVSIDCLFDVLYAHDPNGGPDNPRAVIAVRISRIRRQIADYGWTVPRNNAGLGSHGQYRLEPIRSGGDV